jgi:pimeloyl-ACP methyl ester carboxylesterase
MIPIWRILKAYTPKIKDSSGKIKPKSIASLEKIPIGGIDQGILIRGHNIDDQFVLFLHGGPGTGEMPIKYAFQRNLERHFVMVDWDQRGVGKSYSKKIHPEDLTKEQMIEDAHELVLYLQKRFKKPKISLIGHSWGTILGFWLIDQYPDLFDAFIGIGQCTDTTESERLGIKFILEKAKAEENQKAIDEISALKEPFSENPNYFNIQRKWLGEYGGMLYGKKNFKSLMKLILGSPEFSIRDIVSLFKAEKLTEKLMDTLWDVNFFEQIPEVKIPVYFLIGRMDYQVSQYLAERYMKELKAPKKKFFWFEKSAHCPNFSETDKFDEIVIKCLKS